MKTFIHLGKSLAVAWLITGVCVLTSAFVFYKVNTPIIGMAAVIVGIYLLSNFVGGWLLGKKVKVKQYAWGLFVGVLYAGIVIGVSLAFHCGDFSCAKKYIMIACICSGGGMLGGMLS